MNPAWQEALRGVLLLVGLIAMGWRASQRKKNKKAAAEIEGDPYRAAGEAFGFSLLFAGGIGAFILPGDAKWAFAVMGGIGLLILIRTWTKPHY